MPSVVSIVDFRTEGKEMVQEGVGSGVVWDRCTPWQVAVSTLLQLGSHQ